VTERHETRRDETSEEINTKIKKKPTKKRRNVNHQDEKRKCTGQIQVSMTKVRENRWRTNNERIGTVETDGNGFW